MLVGQPHTRRPTSVFLKAAVLGFSRRVFAVEETIFKHCAQHRALAQQPPETAPRSCRVGEENLVVAFDDALPLELLSSLQAPYECR